MFERLGECDTFEVIRLTWFREWFHAGLHRFTRHRVSCHCIYPYAATNSAFFPCSLADNFEIGVHG